MAATFVVEDGTGLTNANSYLSVADATAYFDNHGAPSAWTSSSTAQMEDALRLATQYVDATYAERWKGTRIKRDQALDHPRVGIEDRDGYVLDSDKVAQQVKDATCEAALRVRQGDTLVADLSNPGTIASEHVRVGPIEESITYTGGKAPTKAWPIISALLRDLVFGGGVLVRG